VHIAHSYPNLAHLFSAYFHQDALDEGQTDEDIIRDFAETSHDYDVLGTRADILRFLHVHADDADFLGTMNRSFKPDISIAATSAEARAWLEHAHDLLQKLRAQ